MALDVSDRQCSRCEWRGTTLGQRIDNIVRLLYFVVALVLLYLLAFSSFAINATTIAVLGGLAIALPVVRLSAAHLSRRCPQCGGRLVRADGWYRRSPGRAR